MKNKLNLLFLSIYYNYAFFLLGISKKSRSLFMELDANAVKTKQTVPVVNIKKEYIPTKQVKIQFEVF